MAYGFFPAAGTDYTHGQEPTIASRLGTLAKSLHLHLTGISGYRTPAHSVAVGGFADDPHTRGAASDTPGVESVPEATLRKFGLTRPFPGAQEADHIQLLGGGGTTTSRTRNTGGKASLADLWKGAGGSRNLAPIMAAIAMAESGGRVDAVGGPNSNGTYDYGLWQINSVHSQFDKARLISDPQYNAQAAVAIEKSQGLGAWSTYNSGAYKGFLGSASSGDPTFSRSRPGGESTDGSGGISDIFASYVSESDTSRDSQNVSFLNQGLLGLLGIPIPKAPNPLDLLTAPATAIKDTADFLKWISWIFHPRNILRVVEFITGMTFIGFGLHMAIEAHRDSSSEQPVPILKRAAAKVVTRTPAGNVASRVAGKRAGKAEARNQSRRKNYDTSRNKERSRQKTKSNEREMNARYGGVPF